MNMLSTPAANQNLIKDSTTRTFVADVVEASKSVPVIVDFWAPWCGPCKTLGPILEKLVREAGGRVKLVKVDIDQNPEIAGQMRVQSIPAVFAFVDGRPVDGFMGALPESQVKQFIARLGSMGSRAEQIEAALQMARDDYEDRRERQRQGIELAKVEGRYEGRKPNRALHARVVALRESGSSIADTARLAGCSESQVKRIWAIRRQIAAS